jgi:hypothetical protein
MSLAAGIQGGQTTAGQKQWEKVSSGCCCLVGVYCCASAHWNQALGIAVMLEWGMCSSCATNELPPADLCPFEDTCLLLDGAGSGM